VLDRALFRRFDDIIQYELPDKTAVTLLSGETDCAYAAKGMS
jgi:hypothetical protein